MSTTHTNDGTNTDTATEDHHAHDIPLVVAPIVRAGRPASNVTTLDEYRVRYAQSIANPSAFWSAEAKARLTWFHPFDSSSSSSTGSTVSTTSSVLQGGFAHGDVTWFAGGKLNVCYNAVDRHVTTNNDATTTTSTPAIVWEGDEVTDIRRISYRELQRKVCQIANALQVHGVERGHVVTIYMPMIPELAMTMLACTRLGAIHSVVFAGFSADALAARVAAAKSRVIVTADIGRRGGKTIALHQIVTEARTKHGVEELLTAVLVWERFHSSSSTQDTDTTTAPPPYVMQPKDVRMDLLVAAQRPYSVPVWMDAEDPLFLLYTSGSTGHPKGLLHTTGGYALYAAFTTSTSFDVQPARSSSSTNDLFACVADCGWITGHTYVVYGPLLNGATTFMFESTPVYPNPGRYWDMIQRHRITQFYTAPTAIRLLMRYGDDVPASYDTSSVRVLGTVGEPINPEAWRWYYEVVGKKQCSVVDTYWQTETGGHIITNLPGVTPMKPGSCTLPSYGIEPVILDPVSGREVTDRDAKGNRKGVLALKHPWPGLARTCLGDHERYMQTYFDVYPGYYFTGDSAVQDADGYTFIIGRVDDVLNVSGHRIGTAEVESALVAHASVAQAAVVGQPHEIKGQSIAAFCMLVAGVEESAQLLRELKQLVRQDIGSFATPDLICVAPSLPMTRSGKIMRRILRKIVCDETDQLGDTSTLADPSIVDVLIETVARLKAASGPQ